MLTPTERQAIIDDIEAGTFDLDDALDDIATEQRGEGVRKAIYGGILLVNHEGKAGAVDVKARQKMDLLTENIGKQIDVLEKQMGQFIANNSGTIRSTLVETTVLLNTAKTITDKDAFMVINLSDDMTNYDYIDIEYTASGRTQIARFTPSQIRQTVHWSESVYIADNGTETEGTSPAVQVPYARYTNITFKATYQSADQLEVCGYKWSWSGKKDERGSVSNLTNDDGAKIMRVVGTKYTDVDSTTKDAELTDLRVGYDDTQYSSAGEALRAQIQALWTAVNAINVAAITVDENGYLRFDGGDSE